MTFSKEGKKDSPNPSTVQAPLLCHFEAGDSPALKFRVGPWPYSIFRAAQRFPPGFTAPTKDSPAPRAGTTFTQRDANSPQKAPKLRAQTTFIRTASVKPLIFLRMEETM